MATGISEPGDFHNLSAARLDALMRAIRKAAPTASPTPSEGAEGAKGAEGAEGADI